MPNIIFASDLDNTLLFSSSHARESDICVEMLDGAPQGYLAQNAPEYLAKIMQLGLFIPITSRSMDQYRRIQFPSCCRPAYAVTTNGAVLLVEGEMDQQWRNQSQEEVLPWQKALADIQQILAAQPLAKRYRLVDHTFVFAACDHSQDAITLVETLRQLTPLHIEVWGRKIYFLPPPVNKGAAIAKLRNRFQAQGIICAGDSAMDIPMLLQADIAIVPNQYPVGSICCTNKLTDTTANRFDDFVLPTALCQMAGF